MVTGVGQLPSFAFCREALSILMLHYPSRLGNFFLVNAGMAVSYLWQAISLLLPQVTQSYAARSCKQRAARCLSREYVHETEIKRLRCLVPVNRMSHKPTNRDDDLTPRFSFEVILLNHFGADSNMHQFLSCTSYQWSGGKYSKNTASDGPLLYRVDYKTLGNSRED